MEFNKIMKDKNTLDLGKMDIKMVMEKFIF
jgi:hypothetical protein